MSDEFWLRIVPETHAGRLALLQELYEGPPVFCECGCSCIVGRGAPLIDRETFLELLSASAKEE